MKVIEKGPGEPELAVLAAVHGDELCGKEAIEKFRKSDIKLNKSVKFVIANKKALEKEERFVDTDLNRCFPGNLESEKHEERLASEVLEELEDLKTLVIHSMEDFEEMFALLNGVNEDLIKATGVNKAVNVRPLDEGSVEKYLDAVSVETGEKSSEKAVENSYQVILDFLSYFEAVDLEKPDVRPELFEMYEKVSGNYEFLAENFSLVEEGEKFGQNQDEELIAQEAFYPILMSSEGYEDILGFKGRRPENELKDER